MAYEVDALYLSAEQCDVLLTLCQRLDIAPGPGGSRITDPKTTEAVLGDTVRPWVQTWTRLMLVALYPSSQLVAHTDPPIHATRTHIPLTVNPDCWVFSAGDWQQLARGQGYRMDPTQLHGAVNWGASLRLHLVVDR